MKLNFEIKKSKTKKLYIQLYVEIKNIILTKQILPNEKLPSVRQLVNRFSLNSSTILKAYKLLETEGHIYKIPGSGTYIKDPKEQVEDKKQKFIFKCGQIKTNENINFASATPSVDVFPTKKFQEVINRVFDEVGGEAFKYHENQGFIGLREILSKKLNPIFKDISSDDIQITCGAQQALDLIKKSLLKPTSTLILSRPTYFGAISVFKGSCNIKTVEMLEDGFDMVEFEEILTHNYVDFVFTMINFESPTGIRWSYEKKMKLLELSKKYDFIIIEDDCLSELYFYDNPVSTLKALDKDNKVIYIKSFSKILMPGIKVAYMIVPKDILQKIIAAKFASDVSTSGLNQRALTYLLEENFLDGYFEKTRKIFRGRFELIVNLIDKIPDLEIYYRSEGGFYLWIILPDFVTDYDLYFELKNRGVSILPGSVFYPENANINRIRISFAAVTEDQIKMGIKILNDTILYFKNFKNSSDNFTPII